MFHSDEIKKMIAEMPEDHKEIMFYLTQTIANVQAMEKELNNLENQQKILRAKINNANGIIVGIVKTYKIYSTIQGDKS